MQNGKNDCSFLGKTTAVDRDMPFKKKVNPQLTQTGQAPRKPSEMH